MEKYPLNISKPCDMVPVGDPQYHHARQFFNVLTYHSIPMLLVRNTVAAGIW